MSQTRGIRIGAIALGVLVDKAAFIVLATALTAMLSTSSTAFSVAALLLGTACTSLGAYVAALRAHTAFLTHGLLVAAVGFAISFARFPAFTLNPPEDSGAVHPLWWEFLGWSLLVVAGVFGGSIARRQAAESERSGGSFAKVAAAAVVQRVPIDLW